MSFINGYHRGRTCHAAHFYAIMLFIALLPNLQAEPERPLGTLANLNSWQVSGNTAFNDESIIMGLQRDIGINEIAIPTTDRRLFCEVVKKRLLAGLHDAGFFRPKCKLLQVRSLLLKDNVLAMAQ